MKILKLVLVICLLSCFSFENAIAQVDLTDKQQIEYNKQKLTMKTWGSGQGSYGGGNISYTYSTKWSVYQGLIRIYESDLYSMTGYNDLAEQARIRAKKRKIFKPLKWSLLGAGLVTVFAAGEDPDFIVRGVGLGLLVGSIGVSIADIKVSGNIKPYNVAAGMADTYNLELGISIKKKF